MQDSQLHVIDRIIQGDRKALHEVYLEHKSSFIEWAAAAFKCGQEDAEDIWQEVIIVFYENIITGKVESLKSQVRTYLFGIGRYMLLRKFEKQKRWTDMPETETENILWMEQAVADHEIELSDRQQLLYEQLNKLGENCRKLLTYFYYRRYSTESIMSEMGYKNESVAKSQKARCMRSLRKNMQGLKNEF